MSPRPAAHALVTDLALARRLERAEGGSNAACVEAHAARRPQSGAAWCDIGGTYAMFDGVGSPLTQTFGLGLFSPPSDADFGALEDFFQSRGAGVFHEVSPLAHPSLLETLRARRYHPIELSTVLHLPLGGSATPAAGLRAPSPGLTTRRVGGDELAAWTETSALGWGETPELGSFVREYGATLGAARGVSCFVAELDGRMIAAGALSVQGDIALLAGASTIPAWRGRGAQGALLRARLEHARGVGCELAMMAAAPGSTSQCNAERAGFRVAYTRTKWALAV
ncbi:MAG: GNAT family N-acetyltransferase [Gemmatimonadaceae bacterium]|nr:GNAT family N-acetyltransferase [Gemmatimonadaceae bacterium]